MRKSKRSPNRRSTPSDTRHEDVKTSDSDSDNVPTWDTSPNSLPGWLVALGECIMEDTAFAKLITVGWVMKRNDICCASQNHIDIAYRQLIAAGTISAPCMITPTSFLAFTADTLVPPAQYKEMYEAIEQLDQELQTFIVKAVPDKDTKKNLRTIGKGSGRTLLVHLEAQKQKVLRQSANYGQALTNEFDAIEKRGIPHATCKEYSAFKSSLNEIRGQLPADRAILDGTFSGKLINAVRSIGTNVERDLDIEIRLTNARGDLDKVDMDHRMKP